MVSPRWRKVLRDMASYKARTFVVVLSITVGVFALGVIGSAQVILDRDLTEAYMATDPASAVLYTSAFDEELVASIRAMPEVGRADGRRSVNARVSVGPGTWHPLEINAIPDFNNMPVDKVFPESGAWPPPRHEILLERASIASLNKHAGDTILVEMPDGKQRSLRIAGLAHDLSQAPTQFTGNAYSYVTLDTLEWLGAPRSFDQMHVQVTNDTLNKAHIQTVANAVRDKIEKSGRTVYYTYIPPPGKHPADESIAPLLLILGVLGFLALALSGFLVVNTITALLAQQVRQIGVMKAVGARTPQIAGMYLGTIAVYSLLALCVAVPLGVLGAYAFTRFVAALVNFDLRSFGIPPRVLMTELAVGLVVPLLASLWPVLSGARVTVREAISTYGLGKGRFGRSAVDRAVERVRGLSRPLLISLRNTFRRKMRLAFTLSTLVLAGAIFIAVFSVRASLLRTLDDALAYWAYDVNAGFNRPYRAAQIEAEAMRVPGVVAAESWGFQSARRVHADDTESNNLTVVAPPATTALLRPTVLAGRWLLPGDENAVVVNTEVTKDETDIQVGSEIVLKIEGRESTWRVVGIVQGVLTGPILYANYPYFSQVVRAAGQASSVQVVTKDHTPAVQQQVAQALEAHFESLGLRVSATGTTGEIRERVEYQFNLIVIFLLIMAVLIAVVGGLGLMGTMSINVFERAREIGVMRAIGASSAAILQIFMVEGILIGLLSWLAGGLIAVPIGKLLSDVVGVSFMQAPLTYTFSFGGALLWLAIVVVLAGIATFWPSWNATRLSVRDVLAYE